ncbi:MAG TPA: DUF6152 family protein [Gammaproteobacteria bacterium]|jgi:hypothetical protein
MIRISLLIASLAMVANAEAHHATTVAYDRNNIATIEGELTSVFWQNPHVVLTIERVSESGVRETWTAESGSPNSLQRIGIGSDIVAVGDRVSLTGALSRQGLPAMAAFTMKLADGRDVPLWPQRAVEIGREVRPAPFSSSAVAAGERDARGVFRVWSRTGGALEGNLPLTAAALSARQAWDPLVDDPALRCEPPGMPTMMNNPYPIQFVDRGDTILLRLEEWDGERIIHMNAGASPENQAASLFGYSVGRWQDRTLIVTTTRISDAYFDDLGTPQGPDAEIVERFTLSADERRLDYVARITDPATFTEPASLTGSWEWIPGEQIKVFNCSLREGG